MAMLTMTCVLLQADIMEVCASPVVLAQQLTLVELVSGSLCSLHLAATAVVVVVVVAVVDTAATVVIVVMDHLVFSLSSTVGGDCSSVFYIFCDREHVCAPSCLHACFHSCVLHFFFFFCSCFSVSMCSLHIHNHTFVFCGKENKTLQWLHRYVSVHL